MLCVYDNALFIGNGFFFFFRGEERCFLIHPLALSFAVYHGESFIVSLDLRCKTDLVNFTCQVYIFIIELVLLFLSSIVQTTVDHIWLDAVAAEHSWKALMMIHFVAILVLLA